MRELIDPIMVGEVNLQLRGQVRVAGEQLLPVGRAAGVHGLQVRRDDFIDALVARGERMEFIGHGVTPVPATAGVTVSVRV